MSTAHKVSLFDKKLLWLFPLPTERSSLCSFSKCIQVFRSVSVAIATPGGCASRWHVTLGGEEEGLDLSSAPSVFLSYTEKPYPRKHWVLFSSTHAFSSPQTKGMKGWRIWSVAASLSAVGSVFCVSQKLQECDIKKLEICEEKQERERSQIAMKGEGGKAGEIDEGEGRRQALGRRGMKAGGDLQPSFQWARGHMMENKNPESLLKGVCLPQIMWKCVTWHVVGVEAALTVSQSMNQCRKLVTHS